jgi:exodeoxyribonuclease VII large subunit
VAEVLTVGQLAGQLQGLLGQHFGSVAVEGEVSRFTAARSGHWYFSLTDGEATLSAAMFRGANRRQDWCPRNGDRVIVFGQLDFYAPSGRTTLLTRRMVPAGAGERQRALEALKRKLQAEGLFDAERKQELPFLPRAVGVATSATGAALQDILHVLGRRYPGIPVYLASCRVQGFEAEREIAEAIDLLDEFPKVDVIIVGRGGGSAEDLWAFNLESVVRAVARCRTPIVSAVGHEIDVSLTDFVADARAPTPSAAAEIVVPELGGLVARLEELEVRLVAGLARGLALARERVRALGLVHPGERLAAVRQRRLELEERLHRAILVALALPRSELASLGGRLHALSPLAVLGRGYALARLEGVLVTDVDSLTKGDRLVLRFARGSAAVVVEETYSNGGTS